SSALRDGFRGVSVPVPRCAAGVFPAYPVGAVGAVFAFPDGDAFFEAVDHEAASAEGFVAVGGAGRADDGHFADRERADAMERCDAHFGELAFDFGSDTVHL